MDREQESFSPPPEELRVPEEFPAPGPELTPPPEEFPPPGASSDVENSHRRLRKLLYAIAAAALLLLLTRGGREPSLALPLPTPSPVAPNATGMPLPGAAPVTLSPTAAPEPTPEPTPEPEPTCTILFYNFSSTNYVRLLFTRPEAFRSVELELREPILDLPVTDILLGPEDFASGELELPGIATDDLYFEHIDEYRTQNTYPEELAMHAVIVYEQDGESVTVERDLVALPELGWNLSYWPKSTQKEDWNYPGCFRFQTYESSGRVALVLDDPDAVRRGIISVSFSIDGRPIDPGDIQYEALREAYAFGDYVGPSYYTARFVFPKPDWAPEGGTIHVTVVQYLEHYGQTIVIERDLEYSEEDYCSL